MTEKERAYGGQDLMSTSAEVVEVNRFAEVAARRDAKLYEEFWMQVRNFALCSDEALKQAISDPNQMDQITLKLDLPANGQSVLDLNFRPEFDEQFRELRERVLERRLGLSLKMSDHRDSWRSRTLTLHWSSFALALQNGGA